MIIVDKKIRKCEEEYLKSLGYNIWKVENSNNVYDEISSHVDIFFTKLNTFPQSAKYFGLNSRNFLQLLLPGSERRKKRFPKLLRESSVSVSGRITTR